MKTKDFIMDVLYEINHIKKHATKEEISRLDFEEFSPERIDKCIYGQMTGDCFSKRAEQLMPKKHDAIFNLLNGKSKINFIKDMQLNDEQSFTVLEVFVSLNYKDQNAGIIRYLKGETEDIVLMIENI